MKITSLSQAMYKLTIITIQKMPNLAGLLQYGKNHVGAEVNLEAF
jgi:hypothetical protein